MDKLLWALLSCDLEGHLDAEREKNEAWIEQDLDKFRALVGLDEENPGKSEEQFKALLDVLDDYQLYGFKRGLSLGIRLMMSLLKD